MKIMKRVIVALLVAVMAASAFSACGKDTGSGTVTLTVFSQRANDEGIQGGWMGAILKDKFNVELNIVKESGNTLTTRMEAGDLGDLVIWGADGEDYKAAVDAGLLLDWEYEDLLKEHGTYMYEHMQSALEKNRRISGDGKIHGIGQGIAAEDESGREQHQEFMYAWELRYDYYVELGCPEVKDLDDLFDVFVKMKENHPTDDEGKETYAITIWPDWDGNMVMYPKSLASAYYGIDEFALGFYDFTTNEFIDPLRINEDGSYGPYLEMIQYFNRLYRAGLLDPDSDIQKNEQANAKIKSGRSFWSIFNYAGSAQFNSVENLANGKGMYTVIPEEATPVVYGLSPLGGSSLWTIGSKTKQPELCMQIINWFATPQGNLEQQYGPKGLCWDYDENGKTYLTELGKLTATDNNTEMTSDNPDYQIYCGDTFRNGMQKINNIVWSLDAINPESGETFNKKGWASEQVPPAEGSIEAIWRENNNAESMDKYLDARGKFIISQKYSYAEGKKDADLKLVWEQVTKSITTWSWRAIEADTEEEFENAVNEMLKEAKSYNNGEGYNQCVEWSENEAKILTDIIKEAQSAQK
ncbi:MAG: extracellular solute-binding protein [Butyrivibrio sp.]|nr:extracellular solute-binding protein [Butyrivibrio sp.]